MEKIRLKGTGTYPFTSRTELINFVRNEKKILIAINAEKILKNDSLLNGIINENIGYPDGVGAVWALKKRGHKKAVKIPGVELWLDLIKNFEEEKSFYFIGASEEVIQNTVAKLKSEFPKLQIKNFRNGFLKDDDKKVLTKDLIEKKPDVVFVAMGTPRQEILMNELIKEHPALYMGLGGSFDVYSGKLKRAPKFFIKLGIEWLYRLLKEPSRIGRQLHLIKFFWLLHTKRI